MESLTRSKKECLSDTKTIRGTCLSANAIADAEKERRVEIIRRKNPNFKPATRTQMELWGSWSGVKPQARKEGAIDWETYEQPYEIFTGCTTAYIPSEHVQIIPIETDIKSVVSIVTYEQEYCSGGALDGYLSSPIATEEDENRQKLKELMSQFPVDKNWADIIDDMVGDENSKIRDVSEQLMEGIKREKEQRKKQACKDHNVRPEQVDKLIAWFEIKPRLEDEDCDWWNVEYYTAEWKQKLQVIMDSMVDKREMHGAFQIAYTQLGGIEDEDSILQYLPNGPAIEELCKKPDSCTKPDCKYVHSHDIGYENALRKRVKKWISPQGFAGLYESKQYECMNTSCTLGKLGFCNYCHETKDNSIRKDLIDRKEITEQEVLRRLDVIRESMNNNFYRYVNKLSQKRVKINPIVPHTEITVTKQGNKKVSSQKKSTEATTNTPKKVIVVSSGSTTNSSGIVNGRVWQTSKSVPAVTKASEKPSDDGWTSVPNKKTNSKKTKNDYKGAGGAN